MKGLVLAAGLGTRLRPITSLRPKPTISVANRPLIHYAIDNLAAAGVTEIGVVVNPPIYEYIKEILDERDDVRVSYIIQDPPLGLAHAVKVSREFLGDESFVMYLSDNLFEKGIADVVAAFERGEANAVLALTEVEDPRALGVAIVEEGRVKQLVEKPEVPPSKLAISGVYVFDSSIHAMIEGLEPGAKGEYQITDAIQRLIESGGTVAAQTVQGWWKDTGKPEDILDANRLLLMQLSCRSEGRIEESELVGEVVVGAGSVIRGSTVFGPVLIGENVVLEEAFIGPYTTIGDGVTVRNAELEYAVVGAGTTIEGIKNRIQGSLIGEQVELMGRRGRPSTHKLVIGDKSQVVLEEG